MHSAALLPDYDVAVIGGGFYGSFLAAVLAKRNLRVALIERQREILTRASYVNQARVHGGYHYPRSFMTALRSAFNFPRFMLDFRSCVTDDFEKIYAVARQGSKVSAYHFEKFCHNIGAPVRPAPPRVARLFNRDLIEQAFTVRECAFDAARLRSLMRERLEEAGVDLRLGTEVRRVSFPAQGGAKLELADGSEFTAGTVFNCSYSQINKVLGAAGLPLIPMKHEITELAMIEPPEALRAMGVTVMDGPFFSTMPFPALGLHSLSHVRYTPHESWKEPDEVRDPQAYLEQVQPAPKYVYMQKDAQRYLPCLAEAKFVRSLFEVKTVLIRNEVDDGRPILFLRHPEHPNFITVMGGKIDNIYDALQALNSIYALQPAGQAAAGK